MRAGKREPAIESQAANEAASARDGEAVDNPAAPDTNEAADEQALDPMQALQDECGKLKNENLRLIAEMRNQQQRAARDKSEALKYAEAAFARDLMDILDDLERTQESAKSATDVSAVADGVRIVYEHFLKVFKDHDIEPIEAVGKPFDPTYHEAMMTQPHGDAPAGQVVREVARGFRMHERVVRPARVIVSSGPAGDADKADSQER